MVTGAYGILSSGAAYLPVDPTIPMQRMKLMIKASGAHVALADAACDALAREACQATQCVVIPITAPVTEEAKLEDQGAVVVELETSRNEQGEPQDAEAAAGEGWESTLFCIMFTSGSTGRPKGVALTQGGVANYIRVFREIAGIERAAGAAAARMLLVTSVMFVDHMQALWGCLSSGSTLCLASKEETLGGLAGVIQRFHVTHLQPTPTLLAMLKPRDAPTVRHILCSGEPLMKQTLEAWRYRYGDGPAEKKHVGRQSLASAMALFNGYGQTETTVTVSVHPISGCGDRVVDPACIGKAIPGGVLYILGPEGGTECIRGADEVGELCYSGVQLARGYLNTDAADAAAAAAAAKAFDRNLHHKPGDGSTDRLYRTGDMASWTMQGTILLHGRRDLQVKVRGSRVELGEVEACLLSAPGVLQAACSLVQKGRASRGRPAQLVAYVVMEDGADPGSLLEWLGARLVPYMVPSKALQLAQLPLTLAGKIDRVRLTAAAPDDPAVQPIALTTGGGGLNRVVDRGGLAGWVCGVWGTVLGVPGIAPGESFTQQGGDSLAALNAVRIIFRGAQRQESAGEAAAGAVAALVCGVVGEIFASVGVRCGGAVVPAWDEEASDNPGGPKEGMGTANEMVRPEELEAIALVLAGATASAFAAHLSLQGLLPPPEFLAKVAAAAAAQGGPGSQESEAMAALLKAIPVTKYR